MRGLTSFLNFHRPVMRIVDLYSDNTKLMTTEPLINPTERLTKMQGIMFDSMPLLALPIFFGAMVRFGHYNFFLANFLFGLVDKIFRRIDKAFKLVLLCAK